MEKTKEKFGTRIINKIDRHAESLYRNPRAIFYRILKRAELYFVLSGGLAFVVGLLISSDYWLNSVRVIPLNPIAVVDNSKYLESVDHAGE